MAASAEAIRIDLLADHPEWIQAVAGWQFDEWGHLAAGDSLGRRAEKLEGHLERDRIPLTLVASLEGRPVGSASLVEHDLPGREELSPWLASVYVQPGFRGRGCGSALVRRAVTEARRLRLAPLYLFTWDQEALYARLGWRVRERLRWHSREIVVMEIDPRAVGPDRR